MKMRADRIEGQNAIARHGPDGVVVNGVTHTESVIVPWTGAVEPWDVSDFASLGPAHFARLAALGRSRPPLRRRLRVRSAPRLGPAAEVSSPIIVGYAPQRGRRQELHD